MSEWIEYNKTWKEFKDDGLAIPGTIIRVCNFYYYKFEDIERTYLIGDINILGGICDDCVDVQNNYEVTKYRIIEDDLT